MPSHGHMVEHKEDIYPQVRLSSRSRSCSSTAFLPPGCQPAWRGWGNQGHSRDTCPPAGAQRSLPAEVGEGVTSAQSADPVRPPGPRPCQPPGRVPVGRRGPRGAASGAQAVRVLRPRGRRGACGHSYLCTGHTAAPASACPPRSSCGLRGQRGPVLRSAAHGTAPAGLTKCHRRGTWPSGAA